MGNSVVGSASANLTRAIGISTAGDFSAVVAAKWLPPVTGTFPTPFELQNNLSQSFWTPFQDDVANGDDIGVEYKLGSATNTDTSLGSNSSLVGKWIHIAFTYNHSTGAQHVYALTEGFNQSSPSFLITPSVGTTSIALPNSAVVYNDSSGALFFTGKLAHFILTPLELTQAQVIAQFQQRAPISAVTGGGSYTYLSCNNAANIAVDSGTLASNFTKSGTFTDDFVDQPLEW
ncbi:MAG TPA: hypothetical protein VIE65_19485, partial [Methylobacter sp.]